MTISLAHSPTPFWWFSYSLHCYMFSPLHPRLFNRLWACFFRGGSCWGHIEYCERTNMKWVWNAHSYLWGDLNISQLAYCLTSLLLPTHVGSPSIGLYDFLCVGRFVMLMPMHLTARLLVRECVIFCVGVVLVVGFFIFCIIKLWVLLWQFRIDFEFSPIWTTVPSGSLFSSESYFAFALWIEIENENRETSTHTHSTEYRISNNKK